jgi:hypothetical protein
MVVAGWAAALGWVARYLALVIAPATALAAGAWVDRRDAPRWIAMVAVGAGVAGFAGRPEFRPQPAVPSLGTYRAAVARAAAEAGARGRVLVVGDARTYPAAAALRAQLVEDTPVLWTAARESAGPDRMRIRLRQLGFTHLLFNAGQESFWAEYPAEFPWDHRMLDVYARFWDHGAGLVWHSAAFEEANGYLVLYRLARRPGDRPCRAWLPGTAGEFVRLRRLVATDLDSAAVRSERARLDALFGQRADWVSRRGALEARLGHTARAIADLRDLSALAPEAAAVWAAWSLPVDPGVLADPARLAAVARDRFARHESQTRACFALGVPWAFIAPPATR